MTITQDIIKRLDPELSRLVMATREFWNGKLRVKLETTNNLWVDCYESFYKETGNDHFGPMLSNGNMLETPEEWRSISQEDQKTLTAHLKTIYPILFQKELHTIKPDTDKGPLGILKELIAHGMIRKSVLVIFNKPTKIWVNRSKTKEVLNAKLYIFYSTNGQLCYSTRASRVHSGFKLDDDIISNIETIQEII